MGQTPDETMPDRIYTFIAAYINTEGMPPTIREIGKAMDLQTVSQTEHYLTILEQQERIARQPDKARDIRLT